jgi:hypothetical protein
MSYRERSARVVQDVTAQKYQACLRHVDHVLETFGVEVLEKYLDQVEETEAGTPGRPICLGCLQPVMVGVKHTCPGHPLLHSSQALPRAAPEKARVRAR